MAITAQLIKELREKTNAGMMDCKKALNECNGNMEEATAWLRQKGLSVAAKRADRVASEGQVVSYIHGGGKMGVLLEVNSETDFTARTEDFSTFCKEVSMQIAATNPLCVSPDDLDEDVVTKEAAIYRAQALDEGKPEKIVDKIIEGKLRKFREESCLLSQPWVKDGDKTIEDLLNELRAKTGEKVEIRRYARFVLGGGQG